MVTRLGCHADELIWEPCGGSGQLVDGVLRVLPYAKIRVSENDPISADILRLKYKSYPNITVVCEDALRVGSQPIFEPPPEFAGIIANPPYGAWQTPARRAQLKKRFPGLYVRETYGVFLIHCLNLLKTGGRLVFIIPDTFLWLNRHEPLRRILFSNATIEEIVLFPSKFFPGVNFGYSGLSIISLVKGTPGQGASFLLIDEVAHVDVLRQLAMNISDSVQCVVRQIKQDEIRSNAHLNVPRTISDDQIILNSRFMQTLGDVAELKTGFYSGHDRRWLRRSGSEVPRAKGYRDIRSEQIAKFDDERAPPLEGIDDARHYIPLIRGRAAHFVKHTKWYVNWSKEAVNEYKRRGENPARFQNSKFYFRQGIGIPMVASAKLTAARLDNRLFDQSVVGLFPREPALSLYLLGFLNTGMATVLLRRINSTANNSANYLKRLPIVLPSESELIEVNKLISTAISEVTKYGMLDESRMNEIERRYRRIWCEDY